MKTKLLFLPIVILLLVPLVSADVWTNNLLWEKVLFQIKDNTTDTGPYARTIDHNGSPDNISSIKAVGDGSIFFNGSTGLTINNDDELFNESINRTICFNSNFTNIGSNQVLYQENELFGVGTHNFYLNFDTPFLKCAYAISGGASSSADYQWNPEGTWANICCGVNVSGPNTFETYILVNGSIKQQGGVTTGTATADKDNRYISYDFQSGDFGGPWGMDHFVFLNTSPDTSISSLLWNNGNFFELVSPDTLAPVLNGTSVNNTLPKRGEIVGVSGTFTDNNSLKSIWAAYNLTGVWHNFSSINFTGTVTIGNFSPNISNDLIYGNKLSFIFTAIDTVGNSLQSPVINYTTTYDVNASISVYSIVNNTFLTGFKIALEGNNYTETKTDSNNEGNITFSLGNGTYNIMISHDDHTSTPFAFTLLNNDTFQNLSFSLLGKNSINFSVFDEITEELLPENASIELISNNFYGNYTADNGVFYLQDLIIGEYRITYSSPSYTKRDYYLSVENNSNHSIELYLLTITNGTSVTFTVQDNSGNELENATIRLKRYYISTNSYRTVAMSRTDSEGDAIIDVDFNDAYYETLTTYEGFSLRTIGAKIISTTRILTLDLITDPFETIDAIDNMETSLSFNNVTQTFSYAFTDTTGASRTGTLAVIEITPTTETTVCTSSDTTASGTLICQVNTTNGTGTYVAQGYIGVGGTDILTDSLEILTGITNQLRQIWGSQGVFFTILVAGAMAGLGAMISPAVAIIMFVVSLFATNFFGMSIASMSILIIFAVIGAVIIYKSKR